MPSFDIVSEVDLQEARNAVDNASREVESRFDFRNVEASFELNDASKTITPSIPEVLWAVCAAGADSRASVRLPMI